MPANKIAVHRRLGEWGPLLLLLLVATIWLYRSPYSASNLEVPPDAVEYALAPLEFLETGHYQIIVEGRPLPPRYPPWFPILVILPAYELFGHDPGNAILPVTAMAVAGVGFAWAIGKRLGSVAGGILAGLALLFLPSYANWATEVMTDVPATSIMLATCLLYLRSGERSRHLFTYFGAGVLIAVATLFRPVFASMLLPFLLAIFRAKLELIRRTAALLLPVVGAAASTLVYNAAVFGSPLRNGYKFWTAIPMDYPSLIFSLSYLKTNAGSIVSTVFPLYLLVCAAAWFVVRKLETERLASSRPTLRLVLTFLGLTTGPILLFHLFYFFPNDRFHIPMFAGAAVLAGGLLGLLFRSRMTSILKWSLPIILLLAIAGRVAAPEPAPLRRLAADRVRTTTPPNGIVISAIDPVYLERLAARGSSRRIVPISRNVEYASKVLVLKRVALANPSNDSAMIDLLRGGGRLAVKFVASEQIEAIVAEARAGRPVFLETTFVDTPDTNVAERLQERFNFVKRDLFLYELQLR